MSSGNYGRVVQRARLTRELQGLRWSRQETQDAAAKALRWSVSKLIRVEGGWVSLSQADLEYLLRHYGVTEEKEVSRLAQLAEDARTPGWWDQYKVPDKDFMTYVGYEAGAISIRMTDGYLVPGPLQTEEYMRALTSIYKPVGGLETMIGLRKARQKDLQARRPEQIYVLDEAVLRRRVGNGDTMPAQLRHLVVLSTRPEITILIIPFAAGPHLRHERAIRPAELRPGNRAGRHHCISRAPAEETWSRPRGRTSSSKTKTLSPRGQTMLPRPGRLRQHGRGGLGPRRLQGVHRPYSERNGLISVLV